MFGMSRRALVALLLLTAWGTVPALSQRSSQFPPVEPVTARHGMVVTQEARASRIGAAILKRGGNAVDAAVAVGLSLIHI